MTNEQLNRILTATVTGKAIRKPRKIVKPTYTNNVIYVDFVNRKVKTNGNS